MEAVIIVTVKNRFPLFKGKDEATSIELIELEEVGYELVSQKGLYSVGDKAILIQPDYCVSDTPLFESFIRPGGQESKSMLGKVGGLPRRIRAKKFTLSKVAEGEPVYSNGILLPYKEVQKYLDKLVLLESSLTTDLGITKYEEPDSSTPGLAGKGGRDFPSWLYKTDETNINNLWNHLENIIKYPVVLVGTEKVDGSSITIGRKDMDEYVCSRNLVKPFVETRFSHMREFTLKERFNRFFTGVTPNLATYKEVLTTDTFVKVGKPYLDELVDYDNFFLRGELNGASSKGSGNKNNPAAKEELNIKFFGLDYINEAGIAVKATKEQFDRFCEVNVLPQAKTIFNKKFTSKAALLKECDKYFKKNLIEGIVVRTLDSKFSAKVMNLEYDSKK
jgi:hypothetical protein